VTADKMQRLGIRTGADLRAQSLAFLQDHFGKSAAWYLGIANGEDDRPVVADRQRKSSGSETTFEHDLITPDDIEAGVVAMAADVWAWCEKAGAFGRTVTVKVKFADFRQVTRSRSFPTAIARHELLTQASVELVRTLLPTEKGIRLIWRSGSADLALRRDGGGEALADGNRSMAEALALVRALRRLAGQTAATRLAAAAVINALATLGRGWRIPADSPPGRTRSDPRRDNPGTGSAAGQGGGSRRPCRRCLRRRKRHYR
jgi:hypothetical protein